MKLRFNKLRFNKLRFNNEIEVESAAIVDNSSKKPFNPDDRWNFGFSHATPEMYPDLDPILWPSLIRNKAALDERYKK
jgi:hypothetical protein